MTMLSVLIATVTDRKREFDLLEKEFYRQRNHLSCPGNVEIVHLCDNKEMSVGIKRQKLLEQMACGQWICFFDDDDWPMPNYLQLVVNAIQTPGVDCIGINGIMTTNGKNQQRWCHRLGYRWEEGYAAKRRGFDYLRPIIHFNPVLREKALQAGFIDLRFGEDRDYADRLNKLLTREYYIHEPLFHYRYKTEDFKKKYGIK